MATVGAVTANLNVTNKTADYTAAANDFVLADATGGAIVVTLPTAPNINTVVAVKKTDTTTSLVSVLAGGTARIDGDTSAGLYIQGATIKCQYDGTNWQVMSTAITNAVVTALSSTSAVDALHAPYQYIAGQWYDRRNGTANPGSNSTSGTTQGVSASTICYVPMYLHRIVTIDAVGYLVGGTAPTAGASMRVGVYTPDASTGMPATLVSDLGIYSLGSTASTALIFTLASAVALPKGWLWFALSYNSVSPGSAYGVSAGTTASPVQGLNAANFNYTWINTSYGNMNPVLFSQTGNSSASALSTPASAVASYFNATMQLMTPNIYIRPSVTS